jgi:hypothetical protein
MINPRNLPGAVLVNTSTVPSPRRPNEPNQPNRKDCMHAEIDLRSIEASRVLRFRQCQGFTEYSTLREGNLMSEEEFKVWEERSRAIYTLGTLSKH